MSPQSPDQKTAITPRMLQIGGAVAGVAFLTIVIALYATGVLKFSSESFDYKQTQNVSPKAELRMYFPERMDHASVEEKLIVPDDLKGTITWSDEALVFKPAESLTQGKSYTFVASRQSLKADGAKLGRDIEFMFEVTGAPAVAAHFPSADAKNILPDAKIVIIFDRPVVPLTQIQGDAAKRQFSGWNPDITPAVRGTWRWLSTTTAEFKPTDEFKSSTLYTVHIPPGLDTVSGEKLDKDIRWSFKTITPELIETMPQAGFSLAGPSTEIILTFNQPIDLPSAEQKIELFSIERDTKSYQNEGLNPPTVSGSAMPAGAKQLGIASLQYIFDKSLDPPALNKAKIKVVPAQKLSFRQTYFVQIRQGLKGENGDQGSVQPYNLTFSTVGDFSVRNSNYEFSMISLNFTNPIVAKDFKKYITIKPEPANWKDIEFSGYDYYYSDIPEGTTQTLNFYPQMNPSTSYTVTVAASAIDAYKQKIIKPHTLTFKTAPLKPEVGFHTRSKEFGFFEKDKPPVYYLNSLNVSQMTLEMNTLPFPEFLKIRGSKAGKYEYQPPVPKEGENYRTWTFKHSKGLNSWQRKTFDVRKELGSALKPGVYMLALTAPEYKRSYPQDRQQIEYLYFSVTNMALTLKFSGKKALLWAIDMRNGNPVPHARIALHSLNGSEAQTGVTNAQGFYEAPVDLKKFVTQSNDYIPELYATAERDGDFAFVSSNWNAGWYSDDADNIYPEFKSTNMPEFRPQWHVYTDRALYRPGDTVNFKGITRMLDWNGKLNLPSNQSLQAWINDPSGKEVWRKTMKFSEFGTFAETFPVDAKAATGDYTLQLQTLPANDDYSTRYSIHFAVKEYRKPEYQVEVTTGKTDYFNNESIDATVSGQYYFGAPMSNAPVKWRVTSLDYFFNKVTDGWYAFALEENWCWYGCDRQAKDVSQGEGKLDESGSLTIRVPATIDDKGVSQVYSIEADIYDPNNQVVSNRVSVPVHRSEVYVGIQPQEYSVTRGEDAKVNLIAVNVDGTPRANQDVSLSLYSRTWNTVRSKSVDGEYYYDNEPKDTFIRSFSVKTDERGKAIGSTKIDGSGQFRIVASAKDGKAREHQSATSIYVYSDTYVNWPRSNNSFMEVIADRNEYKPGDTAKLLMKSPFQGKGVKALVTIERENVITKSVIDVKSNAQSIDIPVTSDMIPNAYVSIVVIKPRIGETFDEKSGEDTGAPAFRFGYARLSINTSERNLTVTITPDKQKYGPGEKVTVKLNTHDHTGKPVATELSLGVVDMSIIALTGFELPDLVKIFYSNRGLGVQTSHMLSYLVERFKPGSKGGGGGDPETRARSNFKDTAYWNPKIVTNANGEASVSFTLPDNLTTWQLLAQGGSKNHLFGAQAVTIIETKKVIVRPVRPRFAVTGDEVKLGAIVHNFLEEEQAFTVQLGGKGFKATALQQTITVKPGQQAKLTFPITMLMSDKATFTLSAVSPAAKDVITETIPVYTYGTPQAVATSGVTDTTVTETVGIPSAKDASYGSLSITASPSMGVYLPDGLTYVAQFPYACTEQTISAFLPNIALKQLQGFDSFKIVDDKTLETNISTSMQRLYTLQRGDGGFGYWERSDVSYPYLTAYVLYGLHTAQKAGYTVDGSVMQRAQGYLRDVLRRGADETLRANKKGGSIGLMSDAQAVNLAARAYILYVLAERGDIDSGLLNNAYETKDRLPLFSKAQLAMAFKLAKDSRSTQKAEDLVTDILNRAKVDSRGTHFEEESQTIYQELMHTNQRTSAIVLQSLVRIRPDSPVIASLVRWLLEIRNEGHWDTTQSTSMTILAFTEFLKQTDELNANYNMKVTQEGKSIITESITKKNVLMRREVTTALDALKRGADTGITFSKEGSGKLYYDVLLKYFYTADSIPPAEQGISITREMEPVTGSARTTTVGGTYKVTLTITVPQDRHFVAVESPLPGGMELIDVSFKTSQQDLLEGVANSTEPSSSWWWSDDYYRNGLWRFKHTELRDDRVFLFADALPTGVYQYEYLVRATTPGKYRYRPARVWEMYFPEVFGQTQGEWFTVNDEQ